MPLQRRVPKRGFKNIHAKPVEIVNVGDLAGLTGETITAELLRERGFIRDASARLKILGNGELKAALTVRAHAVSDGAREKIEAAGGTIELIVVPKPPKRLKKKSERKRK
jgi:large subunit ribosomal protein L15